MYAIPTLNIPDSSYDCTRTATNRLITDPSIYVTAPVKDTSDMGGIYLAINEPTTLRFIAHVITQVVRELTGSSYFHFDSDEAHALTYMGATYQRYVEKITQIIRSKGVTPINWNESVADKQQPGIVVQLCTGDHASINHSMKVEDAGAIYSNAGNLYYSLNSDTGVTGSRRFSPGRRWCCLGTEPT